MQPCSIVFVILTNTVTVSSSALLSQCFSYLEALELLRGIFVLSQAGVKDEKLGVSQPHL